MNFTNSPYETMMKRPSHIQPPATSKAPKGCLLYTSDAADD